MLKTTLPTGKIIATPTASGWSQAYSAGGLFLTISLTREGEAGDDALGTLGKKLINDIEAEFFTLEEKTLESLKKIIVGAFATIPPDITISAPLAYQKDDILYVFLFGAGRILLKRDDRLGALLEESDVTERTIKTASGRLEPGDFVLMHTKTFLDDLGETRLTEALATTDIDEIEESLMPEIHNKEGSGDEAALFFLYNKEKETIAEASMQAAPDAAREEPPLPAPIREPEKQPDEQPRETYTPSLHPRRASPLRGLWGKIGISLSRLTRRQKMLGSVIVLLIVIFFASLFFTTQTQQNSQNQEVFAAAFEEAQKRYEEGEGLVSLNAILAREELERAQQIIDEAKEKLSDGSKEEKELLALEEKVKALLDQVSGEQAVALTNASDDDSPLLAARSERGVLFATQDNDTVYTITKDAIVSVAKDGDDEEILVENDGDWSAVTGMSNFGGNIYVLEKGDNILKFTPGSEGYGQSFYFTGDPPTLSSAAGLAIDSAVYVLGSDGSIRKFLRGEAEQFSVTGLSGDFNNPVDIYTTEEMDSIYVLDPKNARIVQLDKNGAYVRQFAAADLKNAKAIDVSDDEQNIFVLIGGDIKRLQIE